MEKETIYFVKRFTTGHLKGMIFYDKISFLKSEMSRYARIFRIGHKKAKSCLGPGWEIVDASFQAIKR